MAAAPKKAEVTRIIMIRVKMMKKINPGLPRVLPAISAIDLPFSRTDAKIEV